MWQPIRLFAGFIPILILVAVVFYDRWRREHRGERPPLTDKLLRPPGYSLQRKAEDLNDAFILWFSGAFFLSLFAVGVAAFARLDLSTQMTFLVVFGLSSAGFTVMAHRRLMDMVRCRRGWLGEQAVAEQLQPLAASGYRIFHDVPGGAKWNIDHVVVGPAGVFAIETKYRTKKPGRAGESAHEANFDGNTIEFAGWFDKKTPEQAIRNATWLTTTLSKSTGEPVVARPIVALPGWYVTIKAKADLKVLNDKQIAGFISSEPAQLSSKVIQQISYQLNLRCRDVEF